LKFYSNKKKLRNYLNANLGVVLFSLLERKLQVSEEENKDD